jgi:acyl-[acyl-carrier-protein]-phospholipid O-acyltransferase/long-chain-fatty-acid--[acyl-carrier-protein] ligase
MRKGERLALLTTDSKCTREAFSQFAKRKGATELMVPADILLVSKIPLLGSGKPDYVAALELAKQTIAERPGSAASVAEKRTVTPAV